MVLADSTELRLVRRNTEPNAYYYYPVNLRLATKADGTPEISFLGINGREEGAERKYSGGILHFLLTWGLDARQDEEADSILKADFNPKGAIWGAIPLVHLEGADEPLVDSEEENEYVEILKAYLNTRAKTPLYPGGKWAASCRFPGDEAEKIEEALKDPTRWGEGGEMTLKWYFEGGNSMISLSTPLAKLFNLAKKD